MSENTATEQAFEGLKHGEFCWTEIATSDAGAGRAFYENVFGWQFKKSDSTGIEEFEYLEFGTDADKQFGGLFQMNPDWYGGETPKPHSNIYIAVDDVDAAARQAFELGGTIVSPPADIPNVGRCCQLQDPTGARFFIIRLNG